MREPLACLLLPVPSSVCIGVSTLLTGGGATTGLGSRTNITIGCGLRPRFEALVCASAILLDKDNQQALDDSQVPLTA